MIRFLLVAWVSLLPVGADQVKLELGAGDEMRFDKQELTVTTGDQVAIVFRNTGKIPKSQMGHNLVILRPGTSLAMFASKVAASKGRDHLPEDAQSKALIVAHSKVLGGGEQDLVRFTAPEPGIYPFLCTWPGHFSEMNGHLVVKARR